MKRYMVYMAIYGRGREQNRTEETKEEKKRDMEDK